MQVETAFRGKNVFSNSLDKGQSAYYLHDLEVFRETFQRLSKIKAELQEQIPAEGAEVLPELIRPEQ